MQVDSGDPCPGIPTVDYGGKTYNTVQIGTQCWLMQNLDVGTMIPGSQNQMDNSTIEKYCYNDLDTNCTVYGGLYQWGEMVQYLNGASNITSWSPQPEGFVQGICPEGWHIPNDTEFSELYDYLGGLSVAGGKLKEEEFDHWLSPNTGATNLSGFTALGTGRRDPSTGYIYFNMNTNIWSTGNQPGFATGHRIAGYNTENAVSGENEKTTGFSVRCIKNGCALTDTLEVTITSSSNQVCQGDTVCFTANITNGGTDPSIQWMVNDSLSEGLVAWYPFNGNANDESGNGHDGTVVGATLISDRFNNPSSAYNFDGNDYIELLGTDTLNFSSGGFSLCAWAKFNTYQDDKLILAKHTVGSGSPDGYFISVWEDKFAFYLKEPRLTTTQAFGDNNWHLLVAIYDGTTQHIFVDGQLIISKVEQNPNPNTLILNIGSGGGLMGNFHRFIGGIDDVRIYERALTMSEIQALYHEGDSTFCLVPSNGDSVYCIVTSSDTCAVNNPDTSNVIVMTVNPTLPVSVTIIASANPVCEETEVTFTATPVNGGTAPVYVWKVNGNIEGSNSNTFIYEPEDGDVITCTLTSNANCATGNPAVSNSIIMVVYEDPETDGIWHN